MNEHIVKLNNDKSTAEYIAAEKYLFYIPGGAQLNQAWFSDCGNWSLWLKYKSAITPKVTSRDH